jgi:hypothetical protein
MHEMGREGEISTLILRPGFLRFGIGIGVSGKEVSSIFKIKRKERWSCI